jgi:proline iminopeptidase
MSDSLPVLAPSGAFERLCVAVPELSGEAAEERYRLYPPIEPWQNGHLPVSDEHQLYYEVSGNPKGKPALFLHGGPGSGCSAVHRRFFDPKAYCITLFDQRGAGRSLPFASLAANTTWDLVEDIERLRQHLGFKRWLVFGGSWGSTLALAYAQRHPDRVSELVLRGIFTLRSREIDWFYQEGASRFFPDSWADFLAPVPDESRGDLLAAYHQMLTSPDDSVRRRAAVAWSGWEGRTATLMRDDDLVASFEHPSRAEALARIECHYFVNKGFFEHEQQLFDGVETIRHIPAVIVQGRYDMCCPPETAFELARRWPEADFRLVEGVGHSAFEPGIRAELIRATDRFRESAGSAAPKLSAES